MKKTDIAYMAGLVDGEGYIGVKKSKAYKSQGRQSVGYHARIQIRMVDEAAIKFIAEQLGGWYYKEKPSVAKGRPLYCYQASDKRAETVLRTLLPFLKVKAPSARAVLSLREMQANGRQHRTKITGHRTLNHWAGVKVRVANKSFSDEYVARCEAIYLQCKALNKVGI